MSAGETLPQTNDTAEIKARAYQRKDYEGVLLVESRMRKANSSTIEELVLKGRFLRGLERLGYAKPGIVDLPKPIYNML